MGTLKNMGQPPSDKELGRGCLTSGSVLREGPAGAKKHRRILLVDDHEPTVRRMVGILEKSLQQEVIGVTASDEALETYKDGEIDLVVSDYMMPKMNGLMLLEALKEHDGKVKVVIVSASIDEEDKRELLNAGAIAILDKPLDIELLEKVIQESA